MDLTATSALLRLLSDPTNPLRIEGVFGENSWLPMPGYREPGWLTAPRIETRSQHWEMSTTDGQLCGALWTPSDARDDTELPLLICHDGTQMAPCSMTPTRSAGNRSKTPSKITTSCAMRSRRPIN